MHGAAAGVQVLEGLMRVRVVDDLERRGAGGFAARDELVPVVIEMAELMAKMSPSPSRSARATLLAGARPLAHTVIRIRQPSAGGASDGASASSGPPPTTVQVAYGIGVSRGAAR